MSNVLVIGDGPLAAEIAALAEAAGHIVTPYLYAQQGPKADPLSQLPAFLKEMADRMDVVVEAVIADRASKRQTMEALDAAFLGVSEPILTATLNASATEVGGWVTHPESVVGWAALPPLEGAQVWELAPGLGSSAESVEAAQAFLATLGKEPVLAGDTVGGVLPRIVANLINEAAFALTEGVAQAEDIDQAMKLGTNYPHGPLAWGDVIGLDQVVGIINALGEAYGNDRYHPAPLLRQYALAGWWGNRTGRGFYEYPA